jgi:hypothetical protein
MKKEEALRGILREWKRLPASERQTEFQLFDFCATIANDSNYWFRCQGDRYQDIMAYMSYNTSGLKKQGL